MMRYLLVVLLPIAVLGSVGQEGSNSDTEAIKKCALDYGEGWYAGDAERMERAVHPDLAKRRLTSNPRSGRGKVEHMSALTLLQYTKRGGGTKVPVETRKTTVTILDVFGNAASVKLEMHDWIDYMHMSKVNGRWVVVNVLWELTPEAKARPRSAAGR